MSSSDSWDDISVVATKLGMIDLSFVDKDDDGLDEDHRFVLLTLEDAEYVLEELTAAVAKLKKRLAARPQDQD